MITINSVSDFFDFLKENNEKRDKYIYRGVKSIDYKLIPSIGRCYTNNNEPFTVHEEIIMLASFKMKVFPYLKNEFSKIELLTLAQHHGLPTRLLDWTWNPLVAFFFAVKDDSSIDSLVYAWKKDKTGKYNTKIDPFKISETQIVLPTHLTPRITSQWGVFTIHNNPNMEFIPDNIEKIVIKNDIRKEIKRSLYLMGIHDASMFPDVEGVASYTKWLKTNIY